MVSLGIPWVPGFLLLLVAKVQSLELLTVFNSPLEMHCKFDISHCKDISLNRYHRIAYRSGVTSAVVSPLSSGFLSGLGVAFSVGASHALESGAIQKPITALHVAITHASSVSVSTQIAALRRLLLGKAPGELGERAKAVVNVSKRTLS